ncbi:MAG: hypothetical protein N2053_13370 [Chitinispirillaceae bacterium]|nr:hypothetical protein [Chitinispirillaceae bacterium]
MNISNCDIIGGNIGLQSRTSKSIKITDVKISNCSVAGVYIYRLTAGNFSGAKKMVLLK